MSEYNLLESLLASPLVLVRVGVTLDGTDSAFHSKGSSKLGCKFGGLTAVVARVQVVDLVLRRDATRALSGPDFVLEVREVDGFELGRSSPWTSTQEYDPIKCV